MNSTYKKIALAVCLGAGLAGLGYYMGLEKQGSAAATETQQAAVQTETPVAPVEVQKAEVGQAPVAPATIQTASTPPLQSMKGLTVDTVADIEIFKSDTPSIEIVGDSQELIDTIKTEMVGPNLIVSHVLTKPLKVKCGSTSISLDMNGNSTTMNFNNGKQEKSHCALVKIGVTEIPSIQIKKSGNVHFAGADEQQLLLKISGSGNITGEGKVEDLLVWISGSGDVDTTEVKTQRLRVLSQGSGDVNATANGELESSLLGSGNITVIGNPETKKHEEKGSGKFRLFGTVTK